MLELASLSEANRTDGDGGTRAKRCKRSDQKREEPARKHDSYIPHDSHRRTNHTGVLSSAIRRRRYRRFVLIRSHESYAPHRHSYVVNIYVPCGMHMSAAMAMAQLMHMPWDSPS